MTTMRAAVLDAPGAPERLEVRRIPVPEPAPGWVLIKVEAFGLNRSFESGLDWATLGAVPEMLQTAHGSLTVGLNAQAGQSILIRGGTSSVGMATAILAKRRGMTVLSTTRSPDKVDALTRAGVDHVLLDDGHVAEQARSVFPEGVDLALELVGTPTGLPRLLRHSYTARATDTLLSRDSPE